MVQVINGLFKVAFSILEFIFSSIRELIIALVPDRNTGYSATFISPHKVLSSNNVGFMFGDMALTTKECFNNAVVLGGSGSGKSSQILIPSILNMLGISSLIIHDPAHELKNTTNDFARFLGYKVLILDYENPYSSQGFNPLSRIKNIADIKKLAKIIVETSLGAKSSDPFWNQSAMRFLSIFLQYTVFYAQLEHRNMFNVVVLINLFTSSPEAVDVLFVKTHDELLLQEYKNFVGSEGKMLQSIVATARQAIEIFADPNIASVTKNDTINFESFRTQKTILYINNSVNSMRYYSTITSIFFDQFFASCMSTEIDNSDLPIFHLLDEASSLYLGMLPIVISNIRKYHSGILLVYQSQHQLLEQYGVSNARNILANCFTKVYMPNQPIEVCRELESLLGKKEIIDSDGNKKVRPLLTMDEIRILDESIILIGNKPALKIKLIPYYKQKQLIKKLATAKMNVKDIIDKSKYKTQLLLDYHEK
jgi:type IV secretion system protein VirD4